MLADLNICIHSRRRLFYFSNRLQKLKNAFEKKYGKSPKFFAHAPGRVNLIGNSDSSNTHVSDVSTFGGRLLS